MNQSEVPVQEAVEASLPWSIGDTWIGLVMLVFVQILVIATIMIFKTQKVYGTIGVAFLELMYLIPVVIISIWRRINWKLLGYRKFSWNNLGLGCGLLVIGYMITAINNSIFLLLGKSIQANQIMRLLSQLPSPSSFIFTGIIVAPIVEETFFRGFLFAGFRQQYGWKNAALLSSAFFAIAHLQLAALVPTFVLGYIFSFLYQKSNSIFPGMIMHFLVNAIGITAILMLTKNGIPLTP